MRREKKQGCKPVCFRLFTPMSTGTCLLTYLTEPNPCWKSTDSVPFQSLFSFTTEIRDERRNVRFYWLDISRLEWIRKHNWRGWEKKRTKLIQSIVWAQTFRKWTGDSWISPESVAIHVCSRFVIIYILGLSYTWGLRAKVQTKICPLFLVLVDTWCTSRQCA